MESSESVLQVQESSARLLRARTRTRRLALALALPCIVLALLLLIDAGSALPDGLRAAVALLAIAAVLAGAAYALVPVPTADALRLAEEALGEGDRRLTAAAQLESAADPRARAHAAALVGALPTTDEIDNRLRAGLPPSRAWRPLAVAGGAFAVVIAASLLWPNLLPACLPRLWDPFGDHPPYSATRLTWVEPPSQAPYNEPVTLTVAVDGPPPEDLVLHVAAEGQPESSDVQLLPAGEGRWRVRLEPPTRPLVAWVVGAGTRTTRLALPLDGIPRLRTGRALLSSPAYANLPDANVLLDPAGALPTVAALPGSSLHLDLGASRVPQAVWLQRGPAAPMRATALTKEPAALGGDARAMLTIADPAPGTWSVSLEGPDGSRGTPWPLLTITARADQPPVARIVQPDDGAFATPGAELPFQVQVGDDLGLARLTVYRLDGDKQVMEGRHTLGGTGDTWRGSITLDGVKPGDRVRLGAVARDTRPPDGQVSTPAEITVTIIALDRFLAMAREQLTEQALMARFAPVFEKLSALEEEARRLAEQPTSPERDQALAELQRRIDQARREFAEQTKTELFAADGEVFSAVDERLAELAQGAKDGFPDGTGDDKAKLLGEDLAKLTAQAQADAAQDWIKDLATAQRRLATEFDDLAKQPEGDAKRARVRELAQQQRDLEQGITDLRAEVANAAQQLEKSDPQQAAHLRSIDRGLAEAGPQAGEAGRAAQRSKPGEAAKPADGAASALERLVAKRRDGQCSSGWCDGDKLGQCRSQLAAMAKRRMGQGGSPEGSGSGGALGMFGNGMYAKRGGKAPPKGPTQQIYGPLATATLPGGKLQGGPGREGKGVTTSDASAGTGTGTPYARGVRSTTAGVGTSFTPGEEALIDEYYRRMAEGAGK